MPTRGVSPTAWRMSFARTRRLSQCAPTARRRPGDAPTDVSVSKAVGYALGMIGGFGSRRLSVCFILLLAASACGSSALDHHPAPASSKQPAIDGTLSAGAVASLAGLTTESHLPSGCLLVPITILTSLFRPDVATNSARRVTVGLANR